MTTDSPTTTPETTMLQQFKELASNPVLLVIYALTSGTLGGALLAPELEEDFEDHIHEGQVLPELRRHWTPDSHRRLEDRLDKLEQHQNTPLSIKADAELEGRLRALEVDIGAAIRLLELQQRQPKREDFP